MSFRLPTLQDAATLYEWRQTDEHVNAYPSSTTFADHKDWLQGRLYNPLVTLRIWIEDGKPAGMVRVDSNGELAFHATTDEVALRMLTVAAEYAPFYGGRLKATLDPDDPKARLLEQAGFRVYPAVFLAYKP